MRSTPSGWPRAQAGATRRRTTSWPRITTSVARRKDCTAAARGLSLLESAARTVTLDSPAISGLLLVFGTLIGRRLSGQGRDLAHLGLGDLVLREVRELLHDGWTSHLWRRAIK